MASPNIDNWIARIKEYGVLQNQPNNYNLASSTNFRFMLDNIPTVTYFCMSANAPSFSSEPQEYPYMMGVNPKFPGGRSSTDISIRFIIDEGFINYREMYKWMRSGLPYRDFTEIVPEYKSTPSDGRLFLLNNKKNPIKCMTFSNLIPTQLSGFTLTHNETEPSVLTATVNFVYDVFNVFDVPSSDPKIY
jgi:hypothetical protein